MRFERGPFGRIAVQTVASDTDVVLHALDVLQNHVISSILPVYIREQLGKIQLCIDCTGYQQLSETTQYQWEHAQQKRKCIADFVRTILDAQDHFMDAMSLVMNPEYVFFDPECRKLYWCCLPVVQKESQTSQNPVCPAWDKLELLMMNPFFRDVLDEDDRNRILCLLRDEREQDLLVFLTDFAASGETGLHSKDQRSKYKIRLAFQFFLMAAAFGVCIYFEEQPSANPISGIWASWYVLIFSFLLIINLISGQNRKAVRARTADIKEMESTKSLSRKEMYFPSSSSDERTFSTDSHTPLFSPAYLTQQITDHKKDRNPLRAVVWVDDFLIGRDKTLCDFFIDHTSVSDRHARILHRNPMYFLVDLGSASGTWIGSRRLYSFEETPLADGDIFICGDIRFVFNHTQ